jgi:hypothetical protein
MAVPARLTAHVTTVIVIVGVAALTGHEPVVAAEPLTVTDRVAVVVVPPALYPYGVDNIGAKSIVLWTVCMTVT